MTNKIKEGLADLADRAERDHEVQMARSDLYKLAKYSIKLHEMLKNVSEAEGIEGWQQAKITKAADYISSVYHSLDYEMNMETPMPESVRPKRKTPTLSEAEFSSYKASLRAKLGERAVSKDQRRAAAIALKHKKEGTRPEAGTASADMMDMSVADLEDFASGSEKGLPQSKS